MKLLTLARDLSRRKARDREGLFVAEGVRCVEALVESAVEIRGVLIAPQLAEAPCGAALIARCEERGLTIQRVSAAEFGSAAETESPQGVLAVGVIPEVSFDQLQRCDSLRLLVLDAVQDPGNVGTIVRTAAALGATATLALPGTVDLWNAKVVRSAMGAHFHHPASACGWDAFDAFRAAAPLAIWGADAAGVPLETLTPPSRLALIVGNEGAGLSDLTRERIDQLVALPIVATSESLNVAVATGILLYQLRQ